MNYGLNEIWLKKTCPKCKATNWTYLYSADDDGCRSWYAEAIQCHTCEHIFLIDDNPSEWVWQYAPSIFEDEWDTETDISQLIKELIKNGHGNNGKTLQEHINNFANIVKGKNTSEL
jgi:hypothetical protein